MRRQLHPAVVMILAMTLLTGLVYTFAFTGFAQLVFPAQADGSRVEVNGRDVGSEHIGQAFVDGQGDPLPEYFQPRPLTPRRARRPATTRPQPRVEPRARRNPELRKAVARRVQAYRELNGLGADAPVPVDAVTASGSGLDPHISVANARLQARRVAEERGLSVRQVRDLIDDHVDGRFLGIIGEQGVNVLMLNVALDQTGPKT